MEGGRKLTYVIVNFSFRDVGDLRCASVCRGRSDGRGLQSQERAVPRREALASRSCRRVAVRALRARSTLIRTAACCRGRDCANPARASSRWASLGFKHAWAGVAACSTRFAKTLTLLRLCLRDKRSMILEMRTWPLATDVAPRVHSRISATIAADANLCRDPRCASFTPRQPPIAPRSQAIIANHAFAARLSAQRLRSCKLRVTRLRGSLHRNWNLWFC